MNKIPRIVEWLFWFCVLLLFGFVTHYYVFVIWELYNNQEVTIFEYSHVMNNIELAIALFVVLILIVAVVTHLNKLVKLIRE